MPALIAPTSEATSHPSPVSAEQFVQILSVAARTVMLSLPSDHTSMGLFPAVVTPRDTTSTPSPPPLLLNELTEPMADQAEPDVVPVSTVCGELNSAVTDFFGSLRGSPNNIALTSFLR
jgi:hypothetical protein